MSSGAEYLIDQVGVFTPKRLITEALCAGEVGFVNANIKAIDGAPVGDTITSAKAGALVPLPGFKAIQPKVFAGLFR